MLPELFWDSNIVSLILRRMYILRFNFERFQIIHMHL